MFNILPYWQHNLETPFILALIMFFWSLPIVFLQNRQEEEKQLWRALELRKVKKLKRKKKKL